MRVDEVDLENCERMPEEVLKAANGRPYRLDYRLRTWFLLLAYDGINLYSKENRQRELSCFGEEPLLEILSSRGTPDSVQRAASLVIEYLRNYPLKYFLLEDSKISATDACSCLYDLCRLRGDTFS